MLNIHRVTGQLLIAVAVGLCAAQYAAAQTIANGGFETNGGAGSNTFSNWSVATQANGGDSWWVQTGTSAPVNVFAVPAPPQGSFAAMTDGTGPGSQVLLQSFTVPAGAGVILSFNYFRNNVAPDYSVANSLDFTNVPNQQARVDILTAGAGPFDLGASVLQNVFQTNSGDPLMDSAYQTWSTDISSAVSAGGTFQLRFAEVDTQAQFEFGVDNVAIAVYGTPGRLQVSQTGFVRNRATGLWTATLTVSNTGGAPVPGPIQVILTNLSSNATMVNNTGTTGGNPYIQVSAGALNPNASASVPIQFTNPTNGFITFTAVTHSGPLP